MATIDSLKGSRYASSRLFDENESAREGFCGIRSRIIGSAPAVIEHVLAKDERLDLIALHYYNDSTLWWRIIDANPDVIYAGDLMIANRVGTVIVIPRTNYTGAG
jgi:nucleoid-associated protein YgaU